MVTIRKNKRRGSRTFKHSSSEIILFSLEVSLSFVVVVVDVVCLSIRDR